MFTMTITEAQRVVDESRAASRREAAALAAMSPKERCTRIRRAAEAHASRTITDDQIFSAYACNDSTGLECAPEDAEENAEFALCHLNRVLRTVLVLRTGDVPTVEDSRAIYKQIRACQDVLDTIMDQLGAMEESR